MDSDDARTLRMLRRLLDGVHLATPGQLPAVVHTAAAEIGWVAWLYLVDYEQRVLVPAPVTADGPTEPLGVDSTVAGRCFRQVVPVTPPGHPAEIWLPVVDGVERLGALHVHVGATERADDPAVLDRCRELAHLTGHLVAAKSPYGDGLDRVRRLRPRTVASDLLHQLLPPLTFACEGLVVTGYLQPSYDVAADAFDYDVFDDVAHLAVLDATGHDLNGTVLAAVALTAYRNSRRAGHGLYDGAQAVDELVAQYGRHERFATGVLAELDLTTGRLRYLNAGHPEPLLLRHGKVVKSLEGGRRILFGLGQGEADVAEEWLEPGDRIVLYTDGITEARDTDGTPFGLERLVDHLQRFTSVGQPAPEALRRISHEVFDHQRGVLQDDATLLMVEWATGRERGMAASREEVRTPGAGATGARDAPEPPRR